MIPSKLQFLLRSLPVLQAPITLVLFVTSCVQIWMFPFFPSQDGPSHSYNAAILARYDTEPIWKEYFVIKGVGIGGSAASHLPLAFLVSYLAPATAEKVLVTLLTGFFFFAYFYLLSSVARHFGAFAPLIAIAAHNSFLYLGFWSFYASVAGMMVVAGYLVRTFRTESLRARDLVFLGSGAAVVYACHSFGWLMLCVVVAGIGLSQLIEEFHAGTRPSVMTRFVVPAACCLPPAPALLFVLDWSARPETKMEMSFSERLWTIYSLSPLVGLHWDELVAVKILAIALAAAFCITVLRCLHHRVFPPNLGILATGVVFGGLAAVVPDAFGGGSFIRQRLVLSAFTFVSVWLAGAATRLTRIGSVGLFLGLLGAFVISLTLRIPWIAAYNITLQEYARVTSRIPRETTILPIVARKESLRVNPFAHAVSHACISGAVNLANYEAQTAGFPIRFRPERSPIPVLYEKASRIKVPSQLQVHRYERSTGGRVDFLFLAADSLSGAISTLPDLQEFKPVDSGSSRRLLLLQRVRGDQTARQTPGRSTNESRPRSHSHRE